MSGTRRRRNVPWESGGWLPPVRGTEAERVKARRQVARISVRLGHGPAEARVVLETLGLLPDAGVGAA